MSIIADLDEACAQLAANASVREIAARWGSDRETGRRLVLVAPRDARYEEIQILIGPTGRVTQIVFDFPRAAPMSVDDLATAYGSASEDLPADGPPTLWFTPPNGGGCHVSAALASYARGDRTTGQVAVVAPQR